MNNFLKWDSELYQKGSIHQLEQGLIAINELDPKDYEKILDIGCGDCNLTIELAKKIPNGQVVAIDNSPEMIEKAEVKLSHSDVNNISILNMDVMKMSYKNEFNAIFSNQTLHWIKEQNQIYKIIYKALKPNGRIIIQITPLQFYPYLQKFMKLTRNKEFRHYFQNIQYHTYYFTEEQIYEFLQVNNFRDINIKTYIYDLLGEHFISWESLWAYIISSGLRAFFNAIEDEDSKRKFFEIFKKLFCETQYKNGKIRFELNLLLISAKK